MAMEAMLKEAGIDAAGIVLDDIDQLLYTPIAGLDAKTAAIVNLGEGVDDMINIDLLNEMTVMRNLAIRYERDNIYTYIGAILVAVNSFKKLAGLYDKPEVFRRKALSQVPPHIYALAEKAYSALVASNMNQAFIISGESGAGKTESMKLVCRYMASVEGKAQSQVQTDVLNVNIVLEAFGNAKTVYNNNSSRFGKFTELQFSTDNVLMGARVREYLLEKSRVVRQTKKERNYHVFYYLVTGASAAERDQYKLAASDPKAYYFLSQSGCTTIDGLNDAKCFAELKAAMTMFSPEMINDIFQIVAGVLHLGNIDFDVDASGENVTGISAAAKPTLQAAAAVLGISPDVLEKPLIMRTSFIRKEYITSPLDKAKAADSRDALAKAIYGLLFSYIIRNVNNAMCVNNCDHFIGILDIFGFENFDHNSFEQLCINLANEQLQDFFNEYIFKLEQMEYKHEGLRLSEISFVDNKACLDMITEKTNGLLGILDEQSYFPKATTQSLLQRQSENFKGHANYEGDRVPNKHTFGVKHYAGLVLYDASLFLEKNRDTISSDLLAAALSSSLPMLQDLFNEKPLKGTKNTEATETMKRKVATVSSEFKMSLDELMALLRKTQPYFIRCVKPNQQQVPNTFVEDFVLKQLRYSGMLETVRIRREGYPVRFTFDDFVNRFVLLLPPADRKPITTATTRKAAAAELLRMIQLPISDYQVGKTKVFVRDKPAALLETRLAQIQAQRLALLKAEIGRKKKEEEERRRKEEEERKKREEEERLRREEEARVAAEQARIAAEKLAIEEEEKQRKREELAARARTFEEGKAAAEAEAGGPPPPPPPPPAASGALALRAAAFKPGAAAAPPATSSPMSPSAAPVQQAATPAEPEMPPPPPLPPGAPSRQEAEARLAQNPNWMEEKELRKIVELHKKWEVYLQFQAKKAMAARREEEEIGKLPPWKQELMRKRNAEKAAVAAPVSSGFAVQPPNMLGRTRSPSTARQQPPSFAPEEPAPRVATVGGTVMKQSMMQQLTTAQSGLRPADDARTKHRTESMFYAENPLAAYQGGPAPPAPGFTNMPPPGAYPPGPYPPGAMPPPGAYPPLGAYPPGAFPPGAMPPGAMPPGAMPPGPITVPAAGAMNPAMAAAAMVPVLEGDPPPVIPPGTMSRAEAEARLAAQPPPTWTDEKELKRIIGMWKQYEQYMNRANAKMMEEVNKKKAEDAKLAALPPWKRQQIEKKQAEELAARLADEQAKQAAEQAAAAYAAATAQHVYNMVMTSGGYKPTSPPLLAVGAPPMPPNAPPGARPPPEARPPPQQQHQQPPPGPGPAAAAGRGRTASGPASPAPFAPAAAAAAPAAAGGAQGNGDWKAALVERKRKEAEEKARQEAERKAAELAKLPLWKRAIMEKTGQAPA